MLSARGQSDEIEKLRGAGSMGVAATIQHELLPIPSYFDGEVELGGQIEPAYEIAGDAFDYAINEGVIEFGVFDAVGHGLRSSVLTALTVASLRLARRRSEPLDRIGESIERTLSGVTEVGEFVTGVVGRIHVADLSVELLNAGHLPPFVVRDGSSHQVDLDPAVPFGLGHFKPEIRDVSLQPGDALYAFSDGIVEAQGSEREPFGGDALVDLISQHERDGIPVQKVCRSLLHKVVEHVGGSLRDDATILGIRLASNR
jgi:serine phosphatase RsbU (regulator of sigma subunit)